MFSGVTVLLGSGLGLTTCSLGSIVVASEGAWSGLSTKIVLLRFDASADSSDVGSGRILAGWTEF